MKIKFFSVLLIVLGLAGCITTSPMTDEEIVAKRAQERLNALMSAKYKEAFAYTSPGFRARTDISVYRKMFAGASSWTKAEVNHVTCEEDTCKVAIALEYKLPKVAQEIIMPKGETWVRINEQWWIYHK